MIQVLKSSSEIGLLLFMILPLSACANQTGAIEPTTQTTNRPQQETVGLKGFLAGNTLVLNGRSRRGNTPWSAKIFLDHDQKMAGVLVSSSIPTRDTGRWWISQSGLFCRKFKKWVRGLTGCYSMIRQDDRLSFKLITGYGSQKFSGYKIRSNALEQ